ncbi:hypothetical protein EV426DRAFT_634156 [Tirmania nivea]|nr:hypothetical protein EV426DRAFT_634156 [Tirmania nivea]
MTGPELKPPLEHAHQSPPECIRSLHKHYQKTPVESLDSDPRVLDFTNLSELHRNRLHVVGKLGGSCLQKIFDTFEAGEASVDGGQNIEIERASLSREIEGWKDNDRLIYEHALLPGLQFVPSLLPFSSQKALLSRLWMRDLSNPLHKTNLHLHYHIPYPNCETSSFFGYDDPEKVLLPSKDPATHKPLTVAQMLGKRLRWMTLGGQYDWTRKVYPEMDTTEARDLVPFPHDTATLIHSIFPNLNPQAAISNLYTPGDSLSPHRDISEASSAPLASISIGTDAIFIIGLSKGSPVANEEEERILVVRIKSGDVILMGGESRWAWHSVPKIVPTNVGAKYNPLDEWPGPEDGVNKLWAGWMNNRRVNLNVRQMWD